MPDNKLLIGLIAGGIAAGLIAKKVSAKPSPKPPKIVAPVKPPTPPVITPAPPTPAKPPEKVVKPPTAIESKVEKIIAPPTKPPVAPVPAKPPEVKPPAPKPPEIKPPVAPVPAKPPEVKPPAPKPPEIKPPVAPVPAKPPEVKPPAPKPPEIKPPVAPVPAKPPEVKPPAPKPPEIKPPVAPVPAKPPEVKPPAPKPPEIKPPVAPPAKPPEKVVKPPTAIESKVEKIIAPPTKPPVKILPMSPSGIKKEIIELPRAYLVLSYIGSLQKTPEEMFQSAYQNYRLRGYSEEDARRLAAEMTRYSTRTVIPESKQMQIAKAKEDELRKEFPKITEQKPPSGHKWGEPVKVMSIDEYNKMLDEYKKKGSCPLGGWPVHFVDEATGRVYFFNTVEELQAYQRKLHPELYAGTPEFEQRIKAQKALQEFDKAFQEKYGNLKVYGELTGILEQAYQEAKKVAETTGSAEEAMKKVEEIAGSKVNEFLAAHPAVSIAEGLNKGTMAITMIDSTSVIVDKRTGKIITEVGKPVSPAPTPAPEWKEEKPVVPPLAVAVIAAGAIAGSAYYLMRKK